MSNTLPTLPPLHDACRLTVVVPAKNESTLIGRALAALADQRDGGDARLDPACYEVIVLCNNCDDDTAATARRLAKLSAGPSIHVLEASYSSADAHVGTARRAGMDLAAARHLDAGRSRGVLATTDADSEVDVRWIAATFAEIGRVDAVGGFVCVADDERDRMLAPARLLYDREREYRRLLGIVEARYDPLPYDREPRHDTFVGASFAVTAQAYVAAGGVPPLSRLEDLAFAHALQRIDARIRHSYDVRVRTSARHAARVDGGFGTFIADLSAKGTARASFDVRPARAIIEEARARRILRSAYLRDDADAYREAAELLGVDARVLRTEAAVRNTFGMLWLDIEPSCRQAAYDHEPVEVAVAALRQDLAANAPLPIRARIASGAG